jgi:hypothetical protein
MQLLSIRVCCGSGGIEGKNLAEFFSASEREHAKSPSEQQAQDESLTKAYTPHHLLEFSNYGAKNNAPLPIAALGERAASLCNFDSELNKANCEKAFPIYDSVISSLPSTSEEVHKIQESRNLTEDKWGHQLPISDEEKTQYWQKLDLMTSAVNMRFLYGVTLNNYGYKFNDEAAKVKGLQMLGEANIIRPGTSEFVGALMQANRHEFVDFRKAASEGAVQQAISDLPHPLKRNDSWSDALSSWGRSKLGIGDPQALERRMSLSKVSSDLQQAAVDAPITTKEFIDKAAKQLDPESASILQEEFKKDLVK